jgi:hypothetical protein
MSADPKYTASGGIAESGIYKRHLRDEVFLSRTWVDVHQIFGLLLGIDEAQVLGMIQAVP